MISLKTKGMEEARKALKLIPGATSRATSRAMNRTMAQTRTAGVKRVRETYHGKAGDIRKTMKIHRSRPSDLYANVESIGNPIPLTQFKVLPRRPTAELKRKRPVSVSVLKRGGGTIKGAFVARMSSGFIGVFNRGTKRRLPIYHRHGPSAAQMLAKESVRLDVEDTMIDIFEKRLDHEVNNILRGVTR